MACILLLAACGKTDKITTPADSAAAQPVVTADFRARGRVESINRGAQFAVVSFPSSAVPATGARLSVYRGGLLVGSLKVTRFQMGRNMAADLDGGDVQAGDEVREE